MNIARETAAKRYLAERFIEVPLELLTIRLRWANGVDAEPAAVMIRRLFSVSLPFNTGSGEVEEKVRFRHHFFSDGESYGWRSASVAFAM
jgi:hypothetical protein